MHLDEPVSPKRLFGLAVEYLQARFEEKQKTGPSSTRPFPMKILCGGGSAVAEA